MLITEIKNSEWKELPSHQEPGTPTWLKLANGNIVLAVFRENNGATGWWKCFLKDSQFFASSNEGYIAKGAQWQPALPEE